MTDLIKLFDNAVEQYGHETEKLRFLPENRFNRTFFPTTGQYDWLSGQILYCLIRYTQPVRVIEISANCGYSSLFSAMALKINGYGSLETFELMPEYAAVAQQNFERFEVSEFVNLHVGDARQTVAELITKRQHTQEKEILFLDSEHTEEFACFYLDTFLPNTHPESLFHMHDVLPPDAKVMYRPGEAMVMPSFRWKARFNRIMYRFVNKPFPQDTRRWVKPISFDPRIQSSEAGMAHRLSIKMPTDSQLFVYDISNRYPALNGRDYDHTCVWRCNNKGVPMEWNDSWWTVCEALKKVY